MRVAILAAVTLIGAAQVTPRVTAEIAGTITTTGPAPTPLARVLVTISGPALKPSRTAITDDLGQFRFAQLPSGSFTVVASRPPYVKTAYGAKRPGRPGTPIDLVSGQRLTGIRIPLARGAAITGMVRDTGGEAAPGVTLEVLPLDLQADPLSAPVITDDRGIYRVFGLAPGSYVISAKVSDRGTNTLTRYSDDEVDRVIARLQRRTSGPSSASPAATAGSSDPPVPPATYGYAPIYYPGSPDPDRATTLVLGEGEERNGVDIGLQLVQTVTVEGQIAGASGALPSGTQVTLTRLGLRDSGLRSIISSDNTRTPNAEGRFTFPGVLPGKYRLTARATTTAPAAGPQGSASSVGGGGATSLMMTGVFWALADIDVSDRDISGMVLTLQPGLRLSGRVAFDPASTRPPDVTTVRVRLVNVSGAATFGAASATKADGSFELTGLLPGTYTMSSLAPAADSGWWLRSVMIGGRDILDIPFDLGDAGNLSGAVVTFSDRHTQLSGTLQTATNVPAPDYFVVVFAADRAYWRPAARRVQFVRPSTDGRYTLRDLPAGDYLIAALTDMEPADLLDAAFMERLVPAAVPVRISEGEIKTQDLRIVR